MALNEDIASLLILTDLSLKNEVKWDPLVMVNLLTWLRNA
jgi:hypothetical protein